MRALFRNANYRWYFIGFLCTVFATQMQAVAVGWQIFTLNHRALDLGLVGLALFLPSLLFVVPAGVAADRYDRRGLVLASIAVELVCSIAFAALAARGVRTSGIYFALLAVVGTVRAFGAPPQRSLLIAIVEREAFMSAQSAYASMRALANVGGPALGGAAVAAGVPQAFMATAAIFAIGLFALIPMRIPLVAAPASVELLHIREALQFLRTRPVILGAIALDVCAVFFGGATALFPVFADAILHVGPVGLGALRAATSLGTGVCAAYMTRHPPTRRVGRSLLLSVAVFGAGTIAFAFSHLFAISLVLLAIVGAADMVSIAIRNGLLQLNTPDALRGRVNAVENVFIGASNELGAFESGTLAFFIGSVPAVALGGAISIALAVMWPFVFPSLARADGYETKAV